MTQIRGTAGYNLGGPDRFGGPGRADATNDPSPLDQIREQTSKIEDWLDTMSDPLKPYVLIFPLGGGEKGAGAKTMHHKWTRRHSFNAMPDTYTDIE